MKTYFMYFIERHEADYNIESLYDAVDDVIGGRFKNNDEGIDYKVLDLFKSNGFIVVKKKWYNKDVTVSLWHNDKARVVETVAFSKSLFGTCNNWFDLFKSAVIILNSVQ